MTDPASALLAEICRDPHDDALRLVYADCLEERGGPGDAERAEFIRCQIEMAQCLCHQPTFPEESLPRTPWSLFCNDTLCQHCKLRRRERELLCDSEGAWVPPTLLDLVGFQPSGVQSSQLDWEFRRGFVARVTCTLKEWYGERCSRCDRSGQRIGSDRPFDYMPDAIEALRCPDCSGTGRTGEHGPAIVRAAPVTEVRTDREPYEFLPGRWWWLRDHGHAQDHPRSRIPYALWRSANPANPELRLAEWATAEAAHAALSDLLIAHARQVAGLPSRACRRCQAVDTPATSRIRWVNDSPRTHHTTGGPGGSDDEARNDHEEGREEGGKTRQGDEGEERHQVTVARDCPRCPGPPAGATSRRAVPSPRRR